MSGPNKLIPTPVSDLMAKIEEFPKIFQAGFRYFVESQKNGTSTKTLKVNFFLEEIAKVYGIEQSKNESDSEYINKMIPLINDFGKFAIQLDNENTKIEKLKPFYRRRPILTSVLAAGAFVGSVAGAFPLTVGLVVGGIGLGVGWPVAVGLAAAAVVGGVGYVAIERPYQRKLAKAKADRAEFLAQAKLDMATKHGLVLSDNDKFGGDIDDTLSNTSSNSMHSGPIYSATDLLRTRQGLAIQPLLADPAATPSKTSLETVFPKRIELSKVVETFNSTAIGINISKAISGRDVTKHTFGRPTVTPAATCKITNGDDPPQEIGKFYTDGAKMTTTISSNNLNECEHMAVSQLRAAEALNPGQHQVFTFKNVGKPGQKNFRTEDMDVTIQTAIALVKLVSNQDNNHLFSFKIDSTLEKCIKKSNDQDLKDSLDFLKMSISAAKEKPEPSVAMVSVATQKKSWF